MEVEAALDEIDEAIEQTFDRRRRQKATSGADSRRGGYEKSLREVGRLVGENGVLVLADWITDEIRQEERVPSSREVRKRGATICRENGFEIPTGSWLGS